MRLLVLMLIIATAVACTDHLKTPAGVIPREKMELVFWDMIQAERYTSNTLRKNRDTAAAAKATYDFYGQIFRIHGITEQEFKKSYLFYASHPDIAYAMFDSILANSDEKRKAIYSAISKRDSALNKNKKDSAKFKELLNENNKPGSFMTRKDSAIRSQLLKTRRDSATRAHEIARRRDSATRAALLVRKRDSLLRVRLLNKKKNSVTAPLPAK